MRFSVAVLDMDWHRVDSVPPEFGGGWTGYSWEPEFFPDPEAFLAEVHRRGMKVTLNLHPADGVRAFEDAYPAMAEALGRDPGARRANRVRDRRPRISRRVPPDAAPPAGGTGRRLLVDGLAARSAFPGRRDRPAVDAQPLPLSRRRPERRPSAHPFSLRRTGQSPLPRRILGRRGAQLGLAGVPARVHRDRIEHRLRVVEPRHRRPHVRRGATTS